MNKQTDELISDFVAQGGKPEEWAGSYSIAPTSRAPIVREWAGDDGHRER